MGMDQGVLEGLRMRRIYIKKVARQGLQRPRYKQVRAMGRKAKGEQQNDDQDGGDDLIGFDEEHYAKGLL